MPIVYYKHFSPIIHGSTFLLKIKFQSEQSLRHDDPNNITFVVGTKILSTK